jgi:hypothetical protein
VFRSEGLRVWEERRVVQDGPGVADDSRASRNKMTVVDVIFRQSVGDCWLVVRKSRECEW